MKKTISFVLCVILTVSLIPAAAMASGPSYFQKTLTYPDGKFTDVAPNDWFGMNVEAAYEYGLMQGVSQNTFGAASNVKLSEVIAIAARLRSIYMTGSTDFASTTPWYQSYVDYAVANEIITGGQFPDYGAYATRVQFAAIVAAALPSAAYDSINDISYGAIPDVALTGSYQSIYTLYRAGILTGKTADGSFFSADNILRSEVAAIATRIANEALRIKFTIDNSTAGTDAGTQLLSSIGTARDDIDLALEYYNDAYSDMTSSNYIGAAALMDKAATYAQLATQYLKTAADISKADSRYSGVYNDINSSYSKCLSAVSNISIIISSSYSLTGDWSSARELMTQSSAALTISYVNVKDIR